jgi:hypothetical protein
MIGHQHIGVNATPGFLRILAKPIQIEAIVLVGKETRLAIVTALDDLKGNAGELTVTPSPWLWPF